MHKHKAYKLTVKGRHLVYIPTLYKVYEVDSDQFETVPDFIESELPLPTGRWDNVKDFTFNGANLLLTNACNLRCVYCYEHAGDGIKMFMSNQIIDAAVHYMVNSALKSQMTGIHANMFGGEPTLAFNSLKYAVETMQSQANNAGLNCRVTITTNGVMSKEKAIWLAENMNSIMISMDGTKEIHDKQRSNSFDTAFANAKIIYNRIGCKKFAIRITVSDKNVMMIQETVDFFGTNFPGIKIALEPMFELGRGKEQSSKSPSEKLFFKA